MQSVVLRDVTGTARHAWIVSHSSRLVYVTDAEGVSEAKEGREPSRQIGFPIADVFLIGENCSIADGDKPDWSKLTPYSTTESAQIVPTKGLLLTNGTL